MPAKAGASPQGKFDAKAPVAEKSVSMREWGPGPPGHFDEIERGAASLRPLLVNTAYRIINDAETAKDIVQDAFLTVLQSGNGFNGSSSLKTYLYRIVINKSIDARRRRKRWFGVAALFASEKAVETTAAVKTDDVRETVRRLFENIPDSFRIPLVLAEVNEMTYEEIAAILHLSINTVRTRIFRCREKLRKEFDKNGGIL